VVKLPEDFVDYTYSEEMKTATTFLLENLSALLELEIIGNEFINERSKFTFCLPGAVQELKNLHVQVFKFNNWVMND